MKNFILLFACLFLCLSSQAQTTFKKTKAVLFATDNPSEQPVDVTSFPLKHGLTGSFLFPYVGKLMLFEPTDPSAEYIIDFSIREVSRNEVTVLMSSLKSKGGSVKLNNGVLESTNAGSWVEFEVDLRGFTARKELLIEYATDLNSGNIEIHMGAIDGPILAAKYDLIRSGGWASFSVVSLLKKDTPILAPGLYKVFLVWNRTTGGNFRRLLLR